MRNNMSLRRKSLRRSSGTSCSNTINNKKSRGSCFEFSSKKNNSNTKASCSLSLLKKKDFSVKKNKENEKIQTVKKNIPKMSENIKKLFDQNNILNKKYKKLKKLGEGFSSTVYLCKNLHLREFCVLKIISKEMLKDQFQNTLIEVLINLRKK